MKRTPTDKIETILIHKIKDSEASTWLRKVATWLKKEEHSGISTLNKIRGKIIPPDLLCNITVDLTGLLYFFDKFTIIK